VLLLEPKHLFYFVVSRQIAYSGKSKPLFISLFYNIVLVLELNHDIITCFYRKVLMLEPKPSVYIVASDIVLIIAEAKP
jgi:hypothetical protein